MTPERPSLGYVLITPARNEETHIEKTIHSMIRQTAVPLKWVIVDDGSTDRTAELIGKYAAQFDWIELVRLPPRRDRNFAGKVYAFNAGLERVRHLDFEVVGNLDADLSFEADYCEFLLEKFREDDRLGVAGTIFQEEGGYSTATDSFEGENHVAGGCQLFRRRCFEQVGGYVPNKAGGIDWIAVTTARMLNWRTRAFREKVFFHHRSLGTAERSLYASAFSYGEKDYYLGGHPLWELFRVAYRMTKRPYLAAGLALGSGYVRAFLQRQPRPVSNELMRFHRKEQMVKLRKTLGAVLRFKQIDSFQAASR